MFSNLLGALQLLRQILIDGDVGKHRSYSLFHSNDVKSNDPFNQLVSSANNSKSGLSVHWLINAASFIFVKNHWAGFKNERQSLNSEQ